MICVHRLHLNRSVAGDFESNAVDLLVVYTLQKKAVVLYLTQYRIYLAPLNIVFVFIL